jgi:CubicO group peptidase (beta-lactamase class C family)
VVRAVDGRTLGTFLREEVCRPEGIDFHVGVPEPDLARVADLTGLADGVTSPDGSDESLMARALGNPPGALDLAVVNSPQWRRAEVAAVNGHGTARAVAGFYASLATGRLLSTATLAEMTGDQATGVDRVVGDERTWGLGVVVDHSDGWGMGGVGGSLGWWSEAGQYAVGFVSGHLPARDLGEQLENCARRILELPEV